MLNQPTIEKLNTMKLHGMAEAFRAQLETTDMSQLAFEERFGMLVDQRPTMAVEREPRLGPPASLGPLEGAGCHGRH
jgi:hypothetical protein